MTLYIIGFKELSTHQIDPNYTDNGIINDLHTIYKEVEAHPTDYFIYSSVRPHISQYQPPSYDKRRHITTADKTHVSSRSIIKYNLNFSHGKIFIHHW